MPIRASVKIVIKSNNYNMNKKSRNLFTKSKKLTFNDICGQTSNYLRKRILHESDLM